MLVAGTLWHFVYDWSGGSRMLGFFFPVNESTWEHMKLCFFPMLLYGLLANRAIARDYPCITPAFLFGTLLSTALIPVIFYTYTGILGRHFLILDLATFAASVLLAFAAIYRLARSCRLEPYGPVLKLLVVGSAICFFAFTLYPPALGLFADPLG